jgi:uncharacterized protein (TIGR00725 family)
VTDVAAAVERLPRVVVIGSGDDAHADRAAPLGAWLATQPVHLVTGGGGGVMAAVSRAFAEVPGRAGRTIGILPASRSGPRPPPGYPNPWVEIPIHTHLWLRGAGGAEPLSRNHLNVLSAEVVVALAGSEGTASEVALALRYGRPIVAHLTDRGEIPGLPAVVAVEPELAGVERFVAKVLGFPALAGP